MIKLYARICSGCGRRFLGKKMDYRCALCRKELDPATVEERDGKVIEWRGQRRIGCRAADHVRHS